MSLLSFAGQCPLRALDWDALGSISHENTQEGESETQNIAVPLKTAGVPRVVKCYFAASIEST
jgi:hypothetical protein